MTTTDPAQLSRDDSKRYTLVTSSFHQALLGDIANKNSITQGEVVEALLDAFDQERDGHILTAKHDLKIAARLAKGRGKRGLVERITKADPAVLAKIQALLNENE